MGCLNTTDGTCNFGLRLVKSLWKGKISFWYPQASDFTNTGQPRSRYAATLVRTRCFLPQRRQPCFHSVGPLLGKLTGPVRPPSTAMCPAKGKQRLRPTEPKVPMSMKTRPQSRKDREHHSCEGSWLIVQKTWASSNSLNYSTKRFGRNSWHHLIFQF